MKAQLDTQHWFAPMSAKAGVSGLQSYLYLSTNEVTPFIVEVYNANTLYTSVTISKGSPKKVSIPQNFMFALTQSQLFVPNTMGLYVKGEKKFFANFRFSVTNHAEILTSKGLAGIGKEFFIGMAPNTASINYINSTIGVTATEDNTNVTLSGYNSGVSFSDNVNGAKRTFILNKGESYIVDVVSTGGSPNLDGLIGSKLVADKPVSVTNGNFNGIYSLINRTNNDILMDQAVPVDRLGNEFVVVKGKGPANTDMERPLIIATEDQTKVSINGIDQGLLLKAGQYYFVDSGEYINAGNGVYNMGISTSKNVYVYQFLAGIDTGTIYATGGMNFIPPLSCFLPNQIDEIGFINEIGNTNYNTKLNVISEKGATVNYNGTVLTNPSPVLGQPNWETYSIENVTGTMTIKSTGAVTAGIAAGSGAVGYGGYFAGFSSVPVITKVGNCPNVLLEVDNSYDSYQWYLDNNPITGAISYQINPELYGAGVYTCEISKNTCGPKTTQPYTYIACPQTFVVNDTIGNCKSKSYTLAFTKFPLKVINSSKTFIQIAPQYGSVSISGNTITYSPNSGLRGDVSDTFTVYIESNEAVPYAELVTYNIVLKKLNITNDTLKVCPNIQGQFIYDLTTANVTNDPLNTKHYYSNLADAQADNLGNQITTPTAYSGTGNVYVRVSSPYGCFDVATITLQTNAAPIFVQNNPSISFCDNNLSGSIPIDLNNTSTQIVSNSSGFSFKYYENQNDANNGAANFLPNTYSITNSITLYVRVESATCAPVIKPVSLIVGNKVAVFSNVQENLCDSNRKGSISVDLMQYKTKLTPSTTANVSFYLSQNDANVGVNRVNSTQNISGDTTFYCRVEDAGSCPNVTSLSLHINTPNQSTTLQNQTICKDTTTTLDAGNGFDTVEWFDETTGQSLATGQTITVGPGKYYAKLGSNGCIYEQHVVVSTYSDVVIDKIDIKGKSVTIGASGGDGDYQYRIDNGVYSSDNTFTNLTMGTHTVYVKDGKGCQEVSKTFSIINVINAFTPNGDGINDVLDFSDLKLKDNPKFTIFDRYGTRVFDGTKANNFIWDGKVEGRPLPTSSYWYILQWTEFGSTTQMQLSGWILLKDR